MFGKAVRTQIRFLTGRIGFFFVVSVLMALALLNYTMNVLDFQGYDVITMFHPMKMLSLSYSMSVYAGDIATLLFQIVPLLVCLTGALSLAGEQKSGEFVLMAARLGTKRYLWSKVVAVFVVTTVAFSLPFLLEIVLNCVAFPLGATGDVFQDHAYDPARISMEANYQLLWLYRFSPYLYAVVGTVLFGCFAGVLAAATLVLSALVRLRFRVLLLLPAFLFLQLTISWGENGAGAWYKYIMLFHGVDRGVPYVPVIMAGLVIFTVVGTAVAARKDALT